ncbi:MAG: terminase family protein [Salinisphaeraceae bacterium]
MQLQTPPPIDAGRLAALPRAVKAEALSLLEEKHYRLGRNIFGHLYPEQSRIWHGPTIQKGLIVHGQTLYARDLYPKHLEFFRVGADFNERCAMCANRVGKTFGMGGYEMAAHLTGMYPHWWEGRMFDHPVSAWAAGKGFETTRDIMQLTLLGEVKTINGRKTVDGRGLIPGDMLGQPTWKSGVADLVDTIQVRHTSGEWSDLGFKSYEQGRGSFEGTGKHVIWLDEEPPLPVYGECLIRTATTGGIVFITFTPLEGMSQVVLSFMPADQRPDAID